MTEIAATDREKDGIVVTVGRDNAQIIGSDNLALQAAVDYAANHGGGTVRIGPGEYNMFDSLHLRSHVSIRGSGKDTILKKVAAFESALTMDGDYGEEQVTLADPEGFSPGHGIAVTDDNSGGFHTVVGTILWSNGSTVGVSKPMGGDYLVSHNARASTSFPVVSGYYVENVRIECLSIQGNKSANPYLTGCRGAGIFLFRGRGTHIHACEVYDYHGDGISFQQSQHVVVEDCICSGNTHLGLHPGSGSGYPVIRNCTSVHNGRIGLFLCWRVKHGIFENNVLDHNGETGISIGHKDTDNTFLANKVNKNSSEGILFRNESEPMAGHRNTFEENQIRDNGNGTEGCGVRILGETHDLTFRNNRIGSSSDGGQSVGILIGEKADRIVLDANDLSNNQICEIDDRRKNVL
jgi:hypothetical protein